MSYIKKPLEELDVIDDFLMNAVATDPDAGEEFCRTLLSVLLQKPIGRIRIEAQRTIPANTPLHRGIRMDVGGEEYIGECEEVPEVVNDDGLQFIYFNVQGTKGGMKQFIICLNIYRVARKIIYRMILRISFISL